MSEGHNQAPQVGHRLSTKTKICVTIGFRRKVEMDYVSDINQERKRVFLGFLLVLRRLSPSFCRCKEVIGRSIPRADGCRSFLEGWFGSCTQRLLGLLSL